MKNRLVVCLLLTFLAFPNLSSIVGNIQKMGASSQARFDTYDLYYGSPISINFTTYYSNTKVKFTLNIEYDGKLNLSIFDHENYFLFKNNETFSTLHQVINVKDTYNFTLIFKHVKTYTMFIENNDSNQSLVYAGVGIYYNDDKLINPGTIPIFLLMGLVIVLFGGVCFFLWKKYR